MTARHPNRPSRRKLAAIRLMKDAIRRSRAGTPSDDSLASLLAEACAWDAARRSAK